jgi:membrane associated rhomboid family serine protease
VEDRLGHGRYVLFYIVCGVAANMAHTLIHPSSAVPTIGASGCIAGVMGAYLVLYPNAKVLTLVPFFFFLQFWEIPAYFFLGIWFILQFLVGTASFLGGVQGGVAWWAHIGGFVTGVGLAFVLRRRKTYRTYPDEYWPW